MHAEHFLNNMWHCLIVKMSHFIENFHHFFSLANKLNVHQLKSVANCNEQVFKRNQLGSAQFDFTDKDVSIASNDTCVWQRRFFFYSGNWFFFSSSFVRSNNNTRHDKNVWHRNVLKVGTYAIKVLFYHDRKKK